MIYKELNVDEIIKYKEILLEILRDIYIINFNRNIDVSQKIECDIEKMKKFVEEEKAIVIGALKDDDLHGFLWAYEISGLEGRRMHIGQIGVQKHQRGKGIGENLLNKIESIAESKRVTDIELIASVINDRVIKFYNECGYESERVKLVKGIKKNGIWE